MKHPQGDGLTRRQALAGTAAGGWAGLVATCALSLEASAQPQGHDATVSETNIRIDTPPEAIVQVRSGKVRGFRRNGIFVYKGVPYGEPTGGAARFQPPEPVHPWEGVRDAVAFGPVSPHPRRFDWGQQQTQFVYDWDDGYEGEDCLNLNVWTSDLDAGAKRPVMVWIHGGGFTSGSSHELPSYDGENLARRGVVLVSINHRLGPLGFMDLSSIAGPEYARSGNVSLLDMELALKWVQENIAVFGGDPDRVTIFGQSGGGAKVSSLLTMPSAKGLFHRAIVQSGSFSSALTREESRTLALATMRELGLAEDDIEGLKAVPYDRLIAAGEAASRSLSGQVQFFSLGRRVRLPRIGWGPVHDRNVLPEVPWGEGAPLASNNVPVMIGTTREEFRDPSTIGIDWAGLRDRLMQSVGDKADNILAAFRSDFPHESAGSLAGIIGGMTWRLDALEQCSKKAAQGGAPVYNYWFTWQPQVLDGRPGAFHCLDLAFCFDNTARCAQATGNTPEARALADRMSQAWIDFAATGRPSADWQPFTEARKETMIFDDEVALVNDPGGTARRSLT